MNRCSKRSFGMKLIGLMTAAIMLLACCMPAFAAESETRTNTESFQLLTYSEDSASMGSGWTWEITLRIRSISLSATECMVFNPMETVYSCIKNPVCTNDLGVYNYENTAVRYDIYASSESIFRTITMPTSSCSISSLTRAEDCSQQPAPMKVRGLFITKTESRVLRNSMCRRRMFPAVLFLNITTL